VVVNELLYDPPSDQDAGEYVELLNRSGQTVDLSRLALADSRGEPAPAASTETPLAPGAYAVLVQDAEAFGAVFPDAASEATVIEPGGWPQLNNGGDTAQLLVEGAVVDAVPYAPSWGGEDVALERIDPAGPSDAVENFGSSTVEVGTPGAENTLFAGGPDTDPPALDSVTVATRRTALTAVFSELLDPASVAASNFSVEAERGSAPAVTSAAPADGDPAHVELALADAIASGAYTLVAAGVRDEAGNTLSEETRTGFAVAPGSVPEPRDVVVNELWYAPSESALEFVELYNRSEQVFDLSRFRLADARREGAAVAAETTLLRPDEYAVLVRDSAAFAERFPETPFMEVALWPALNNGGDAAVLSFGETEIDAAPYQPSWGGSDTASLERVDPAGPSARASNFASSTAPDGATPGAQNAVFAPDTAAPRPVFAREVRGREGVFAAVFSEPLDSTSVAPEDFAIDGASPASVEVQNGRQRVRLVFGGSAPAEGTPLTVRGVADLTGNALSEEASVAVAFVAAPPASGERPSGELVVNEILYDPLDDDFDDRPDQPEYVELYNPTDRRLALANYFLTDRPDEDGASDSLSIGCARAGLAPGGYAVAYAADTSAGGASVRDAFPDTDFSADGITLLPVDRSSLGLTNDGGLVALRRPDGVLLDSVAYRPVWQSEAVEDDDGRALERLDPQGRSSDAANWTTATAASGGTPGRPNGAAPPPGGPSSETGVDVAPSPFSPDGDGLDDVAYIRYQLDPPVSLARVRIYDSKGREVYAREAELVGRDGQLPWKGRSDDGDRLRVGVYVVLFEALDADGGTVASYKEPVVLARPLE
jgi:hypothetical protein